LAAPQVAEEIRCCPLLVDVDVVDDFSWWVVLVDEMI
jgi:hypothetical protein